MSPRTEELLYCLLWMAEASLRPTYRNLVGFDDWDWGSRLDRRLARLERERLVERHPNPHLTRVLRLSEEGRRLAWGGRDPEVWWSRKWDGHWRLVLFDVPTELRSLRQRMRRVLREHHFGCLQGSVWVSPDSPPALWARLQSERETAKTLLMIEGRPAADESDEEVVRAGWNMPALQRKYDVYLRFLQQPLPNSAALPQWARQEDRLWRAAVEQDPLLPERLWPPTYCGREAWQCRHDVLASLRGGARG